MTNGRRLIAMHAWLTGVVTSAARSSRRSAASFARRRAARARARGVVRSCWTGSSLRVCGIDALHLVVYPEACGVCLGVAKDDDVDADICIVNAAVGTEDAKVTSDEAIFRKGAKREPSDGYGSSDGVMADALMNDADDDAEVEEV